MSGNPRPADPNASIGTAIAAAGIACSVVVDWHYPRPAHLFFGVCLIAGLAIALFRALIPAPGPRKKDA
jgi:hypothetical protein